MQHDRLVLGMAAVFAGMTVLLAVLAAVTRSIVPAIVAVAFGGAATLFWYQATGRLAAAVYGRARRRERVGRSSGSSGGSREAREPAGGRHRWGRRAGGADGGTRTSGRGGGRTSGAGGPPAGGPSAPEARRVLGVERDADEAAVRRAYRERVKEVHPDRGGDEEAFRRVTDAYERLTE